MKEYRVKHKPTGLYYQPTNNFCNLSKNGKVYLGEGNVLTCNKWLDWIKIDLHKQTSYYALYKKHKDYFDSLEEIGVYSYKVPKSHFEIEEL